jgi:hypothetical protein
MRDRRKPTIACEDERPAGLLSRAAAVPPMKLTEDDIRKLVEAFLILDGWRREDDEKAAAERVRQFTSCVSGQKAGEGLRR